MVYAFRTSGRRQDDELIDAYMAKHRQQEGESAILRRAMLALIVAEESHAQQTAAILAEVKAIAATLRSGGPVRSAPPIEAETINVGNICDLEEMNQIGL